MTFILGFITGGWLLGIVGYFFGCFQGYDACARHMVALRIEADEALGDMPNSPYRIAADDIDQTWGR